MVQNDKRTLFQNIRRYFREYCNCTGVHGFRYFGEKRTIFERVWWFFAFGACLATCTYTILLVYDKWDSSPVIVTFATRQTPIYRIPFPVVTICPEVKYNRDRFNYAELKKNSSLINEEDTKHMEYLGLLCGYSTNLDEFSLNGQYTFNTTDVFNFLDFIKPQFTDALWDCRFMGKPIKGRSCYEYFTPIITDEGICYSFNMINRSELYKKNVAHFKDFQNVEDTSSWSLENGYKENAGIETYPRRAEKAGAKNGLTFSIFTRKSDIDYGCGDSLQGYKVSLHTSVRLPRPSEEYFRIPLNQAVLASIQPVMTTTSSSIKKYNPEKRECYFSNERPLKYFNSYSKFNCWLECLTNYTYHLCECVSFFMPREDDMPICGSESMECVEVAENEVKFKELVYDLQKSNKTKKARKTSMLNCNCLPLCADLTYDVVTSQTDYDWENEFKAKFSKYTSNVELSDYYMSKVTIFFKSNYFISSQRNELYGPTDFLANFGGLLGLFTGFSVLSLIEIIYFLTVRIACNISLYRSWSGPVDDLK